METIDNKLTKLCQEAVAQDLDEFVEMFSDSDGCIERDETFGTIVKYKGFTIKIKSYYYKEWREEMDDEWHDILVPFLSTFSVVDISIEERNDEGEELETLVDIDPCDIEDYIYDNFNL